MPRITHWPHIPVFLTLLLIVFSDGLEAQDTTSLMSPKEWRMVRHTSVAGGFLLTGAFLTDRPVRDWMQNHQGTTGKHIFNTANLMGDKTLVLPLNAALLATGYLGDNQQLRHTSWNALKSIVATAIITEGLKRTLGRSRPYTGHGPGAFNPFPPNKPDYKALPSGHTSLAFAFFTPLAEQYSRWLYLLPASTAVSRVYKDKHWASDVVLGAAIGFLTGYFFQHKDQSVQVAFNKLIIRF